MRKKIIAHIGRQKAGSRISLFMILAFGWTPLLTEAQIYTYTSNTSGNYNTINVNLSTGTPSLYVVNGAVSNAACVTGFTTYGYPGTTTWNPDGPAVEFQITTNPGYTMGVTQIAVQSGRNSVQGPGNVRIAYSTDGGSTWVVSATNYSVNTPAICTNSLTMINWTLPTAISGFAGTLKIRVAPNSATSATSSGLNYLRNITVTGSVSIIEISGCTNPAACNYDPGANTDNGSCVYPGCNDPSACNYVVNPGCAGTCTYPGCNDPLACNYNAQAGCNDGSCIAAGCTDLMACNYNATAGCDNGSCDFSCYGCTNAMACNFNPLSTMDNGSCTFPGCIDPAACNYDSAAGCSDGSCTFPGCTDEEACNYSSAAGCDNGTCIYYGCMDSTACNYDSAAGCDDGSCDYSCIGCTDSFALNYSQLAIIDNGSCLYDFEICDCDYVHFSPAVRFQLGDGIPNTGSANQPNFNCAAWGYDCGDISGAPTDDPYGVCLGNLPQVLQVAPGSACPVDVAEASADELSVFPNPTLGRLVIVNGHNQAVKTVRLFSSAGQVVHTARVNLAQRAAYETDLSGLPNGFYTLEIEFADRLVHKTLNIQK